MNLVPQICKKLCTRKNKVAFEIGPINEKIIAYREEQRTANNAFGNMVASESTNELLVRYWAFVSA